jgi:HEAT repeats
MFSTSTTRYRSQSTSSGLSPRGRAAPNCRSRAPSFCAVGPTGEGCAIRAIRRARDRERVHGDHQAWWNGTLQIALGRSQSSKLHGYGLVVDDGLRQRIERHVLQFVATPSRQFPALRGSGLVDLSLLRLGARCHPNPRIRWQCLTLLDHLDGDDSIPVFVGALLLDPVPRVRRHALHALSCDRCKTAPLCVDVVSVVGECLRNDDNAKVRRQARAILARYLPDERAARALTEHR